MTGHRVLGAASVVAVCGLTSWTPAPDLRAATARHAVQQPETRTPPESTLDVRALVARLEAILKDGDAQAFLSLLGPSADRARAETFAEAELRPGATRAVVQERERVQLTKGGVPTGRHRLVLEVFVEEGDQARAATWQLEVDAGSDTWSLASQDRLSNVDRLYRLSVNPTRQFDARNFVVSAEDLDLTLTDGSVFTIDTPDGTTGLVLLGRGEMRFHPAPETEQGQVRIFAGERACVARFDAAFVRFGAMPLHADLARLSPRPVDVTQLRRAERVFREESAKSFALDLGDLSRDHWSLVPAAGDFLAEVRTRRFGTLTYARSAAEAEDISFFDRRRRRNIAVYASARKLEERGRFYNEDELAMYDVSHYDVDLVMHPDRFWLEGETTMRLRVKQKGTNQLTIRLADSLVLRSVTSDRFGRLFALRVKEQDAVLVSLPALVMPDTDLALTITYAGRLEPQPPEREVLQSPLDELPRYQMPDVSVSRGEPHYLYSSRSYWYPQAPVSDYATARIHVTVPAPYVCLASGHPEDEKPRLVTAVGSQPGRLYRFKADRPLRYLSFLVSRFHRTGSATLTIDGRSNTAAGQAGDNRLTSQRELALRVEANPRQASRGRDLLARTSEIARFYASLTGDIPYPSFTLALTEHTTPGGHSPGYFAALHHVLPGAPMTWQNDPASFEGFPEFFLAHELAHQWWGQAVGWRNYHEQWLSEGFAQYFAALYARHQRGDETFAAVLRHMRRWSLDASEQGPVYLGYRLGHIKNEGRVFRALVYNKGGIVLHMLRRLIGDEAFFRTIRRFYTESKFRKAGTEDLRAAAEAEAGRSLERFFEQWIYGASLPRLTYAYRVDAGAATPTLALTVEQQGTLFDLPLTLTLDYVDRAPETVVVAVTDRVVDARLPLSGTLRHVEVSRDEGVLAEVSRQP